MNKPIWLIGVVLASLAAGCAGSESVPESTSETEAPNDTLKEQGLPDPPGVLSIPGQGRFDARVALSPGGLRALLGDSDLEVQEREGGVFHADSASTHAEVTPRSGQLLVLRKEAATSAEPAAGSVADAALEARSLAKVRGMGVGDAEIGRVTQTAVMMESAGEGQTSAVPTVHSYKTFIERAIAGIPVQGSRIVVSYDTEGRFRRMVGTWPTLAASGHGLGTSLPRVDIERRVSARLAGQGLASRTVRSRYVYVPQAEADGTVTLRLAVEARVPADRTGGRDSTPEAVLIELDR